MRKLFCEFRDIDKKSGRISGYAVRWNVKNKRSKEIYEPSSLSPHPEGIDLLSLHDSRSLLANTKGDGFSITDKTEGLFIEAKLPEFAKRERELLSRSALRGFSVGFILEKSRQTKDGYLVIERGTLIEVSLVSRPANSGTDVRLNSKRHRKTRRYSEFLIEA